MRPADGGGVVQPVLAGIVTAVVGFGGAFAVVLSGLRAVGATPEQVVSASAITVAGVSAPFWGLAAGLALTALRPARRPAAQPDTMQPWPPSRSSP